MNDLTKRAPAVLDGVLAEARGCVSAGDLDQAERLLADGARSAEGRADAALNHLYGQVLHDLGKLDRAITHYRRSLRIAPGNAELRRDLGVAYEAKSWLKEATESLREAVRLDPNDELAHSYLGRVLRAQGLTLPALRQFVIAVRLRLARPLRPLRRRDTSASRSETGDAGLAAARTAFEDRRFAEAEAQVRAALTSNPGNADALVLYARICGKTRRLDEAIHYARHAVAAEAGNADAHVVLGEYLFGRDLLDEAAACFDAALKVDPEHAKALANLAFVEQRREKDADAERLAQRALELDPASAHVNNVRAYVLLSQSKFAEAEIYCRAAIRLDPRSAIAYLNLARSLKERSRLDEAREMVERGVEQLTDEAASYCHLAHFEFDMGDIDAAIEHVRRALSLEPGHLDAHMTLANLLLLTGRYEEGWQQYEWRRHYHKQVQLHDIFRKRLERFRQWVGTPLEGKSVLVHCEQALGEQMLFLQCVPELARRAKSVTLLCDERLVRLISRSLPQITVLPVLQAERLNEYRPDKDYDYWCALGSLPGILKLQSSGIPPRVAYLKPDPERVAYWLRRLEQLGPGLKVGVSWRGGMVATGRFKRSLDLESLKPLLEIPGIRWVNMQYTRVAEEMARLRQRTGIELVHWQEAISDFDEHAALAAALDHRVSVCNTLVHLSGAMGLPASVLSPPATMWPYGLGTQMPWYPSVRIYRQTTYRDWSVPLAAAATDLRTLAAGS